MTDELTRVLQELRGIINNFVIRGSGVTGNIKNGYSVIPGSSQISRGGGGVTPECCGIDVLSGISSIRLEWDFSIECDCTITYNLDKTWVATTLFPPPDGTFLFRCVGGLPQFQAGSIDPIVGYVFGQGIRLGRDLPDWATADIDINSNDCTHMDITPGFTIGTIACDQSPFGLVSTDTVLNTAMFGTHNYVYGPVECTFDPGFFYSASWALTIA